MPMSAGPRGASGARSEPAREVHLPAPTASPLVLAFGLTFLAAGLVTTSLVSIIGGLVALIGAIGWWRQVLPVDREEPVEVVAVTAPVTTAATAPAPGERLHRLRLPVEVHPYVSGVPAGLAGAVAMAVVALGWGVTQGSIWLPINLLAAMALPSLAEGDQQVLRAFSFAGLAVATGIHLVTSVFVGLLYAVILPMLPRRPILLGGVIMPLIWMALLWSSMRLINPALAREVSWPWFVVSQVAFGVTAGAVVSRSQRVRTLQFEPIASRAGLEMSGRREKP